MRQQTTHVLIACTLLLVLLTTNGLSNAQASQNQAMASQSTSLAGRWTFIVTFPRSPSFPYGEIKVITVDLHADNSCTPIALHFISMKMVTCHYTFYPRNPHFHIEFNFGEVNTTLTGELDRSFTRIHTGEGFYGVVGYPDLTVDVSFSAYKDGNLPQDNPIEGHWSFMNTDFPVKLHFMDVNLFRNGSCAISQRLS